MQDNRILAATILGVCLVISSYLLSSGMKSLSHGITSAGSSIGSGIASGSRIPNSMKVDLTLSGGNTPIRVDK